MTPSWLQRYRTRGFRLVFFTPKTKGPTGKDAKGWQDRVYTDDDYKDGDNVGIVTGVEISPGKFLVDVDLDWTDGIPLARRLLPKTDFGFGRASRIISHAFYTTAEPLPSQAYKDIDGQMLVELRGTKEDGTLGKQTMAPPSVHPNEEVVTLRTDGEIAHVDTIARAVLLYAIACLFLRHLGERGLIHDTRLALAGFLLGLGLSEAEVIDIGEAIAGVTGNDVSDVATTVKSTAARLRRDEKVQGKTALLKALGDEHGKKILSLVRGWLGGADFIYDAKGDRILPNNQENIRRAFEKMSIGLSFDLFSQKSIIHSNGYKGPILDQLVTRTRFAIETSYGFLPQKDVFYDVLTDTAFTNPFHPILDYLRSLTWDGTPRIHRWLIEAGGAAVTDLTQEISALVLMAACRRVRVPGCKFDEMLILESGTQGMFKSSALRALCPQDDWFSDDLPLDVDAKQFIERTAGKWIIEASDLSGMSPRSIEHLKALLSRQVDGPVRLAYGRMPVEQPRQCVIIGTTNQEGSYLSDATGNRRFWPVRVEKFSLEWIRRWRDQLWAEAFAKEQDEGRSIRLSEAFYTAASHQQARRTTDDPWYERILAVVGEEGDAKIGPEELWQIVGEQAAHRDVAGARRIAQAMQKLGFKPRTVRDPETDKPVKGWGRGPSQRSLVDWEEDEKRRKAKQEGDV